MNKPLVSIIIPVHNAEIYLEESIHSALQQTWQNTEIIIVDDGSTDSSVTIAKKQTDKRIKVITQAKQGASAARNTGIKAANGQYLQFLDADDLLSENKIESQLVELNGYDDYVGLCRTVHFQDSSNPLDTPLEHEWFSSGSDDPVDFLIKLYGGPIIGPGYGGMIQPNAWLVPRNVIDKAGLWNKHLALDDDGEYFCRVILASKGIKYSHTAINYYRKHINAKSLSSQRSSIAFEDMLMSIDLKYDYLKQKTDNPMLKPIFAQHYAVIGVSSYPQYKTISKKAIIKARAYGSKKIKYHGGAISIFLSKFLGWRFMRMVSYWRYNF